MPITAKRSLLMRPCLPERVLKVASDGARASSSLETGGRDALDEKALEEQEEGEDRQKRERRHGEERAPIRHAGRVDEGAQTELDRIGADVVQIDEWAEEVVPGKDEGEDRGGGERGQRQGQDDLEIDAPRAAAVEHRGL